tara:strand:+ start:718 stop:1026 length:309 start_codon:yes stop_codon:yes gene_type:complete
LVLVSQETSICWSLIDTVAAGNSQKHGITTFRPGCAILVNFPNCSISVTVPVFTVTQGMNPHDIVPRLGFRVGRACSQCSQPSVGDDHTALFDYLQQKNGQG